VAYRADIEIAVKGAQELKRLGDQISATGKLVDGLNKYLENIGGGGVVRNINNLNDTVGKAAAAFNQAALGTQEATLAARNYIAATDDLNTGLRERLSLLKQVNDADRQQRLSAVGIRETTQYGGPIGPGQATPVALSSQLRGRTEQILAERKGAAELTAVLQDLDAKQRQLENSKLDAKAVAIQAALDKQAAATLETATQTEKLTARQQDFIARTDAAAAAARRQTAEFVKQQRLLRELQRGAPASTVEFGPGGPGFSGGFTPAQRQQANQQASLRILQEQNKVRRQTLDILSREERFEMRLRDIRERNLATEKQRSKTREAASNAVIGGAFPLLFGQGLGASIGGGLGGFAGGMAGGQFGFGLSLVGTAVGASLDQAVNSAKEFAKSLRQGGDAAGYLEQQLGFIDPTIRSQIQNLQNSGQTAAAADLAFQQLAKTVGQEGAKAFLEQGKANNDLEVSLRKVTNSFVAAGLAANRYFQELKYGPGGKFTDLLPEQFRPEPTPESPAVTGAFTQRTQQLQRDADLLREQVKLTSVSTRADLDRFVVISKTIAQKEYENQLSQISIQLKSKEIDLEQNKQLITAANLQLTIKLGEIERTRLQEVQRRQDEQRQAAEQALRKAEQARQNEISIFKEEIALANQINSLYVEQVEAQVRGAAFVDNEAAGILKQLSFTDKVYDAKKAILENDREAALVSAKTQKQEAGINEIYERRLAILNVQTSLEKESAQRRFNVLVQTPTDAERSLTPVQEEINLLNAKLSGQEKEYKQKLAIDALVAAGVPVAAATAEVEVRDALNERLRTQLQLQQQLEDLLNQVGSTLGSVFQQLIFSTDSWTDSLRNALNALANILFQAGLSGLAGTDGVGFFSFLTGTLGKRARGGPVTGGSPYIVGERGPELFVPGAGGTIVPNDKLGGGGDVNVVVNVDASGSSVEGNEQEGQQLGRVIAAAMQAELIKQKRPGGLLA